MIDRSKDQYLSVTYAKFFINQTNGSRDIVKCTSKHKGCTSKHRSFWQRFPFLFLSGFNGPGPSVATLAVIKHTILLNWEPLRRRVGVHPKRRILNNCIMERLSVKIINCTYLPSYALAVTTNYDLPP